MRNGPLIPGFARVTMRKRRAVTNQYLKKAASDVQEIASTAEITEGPAREVPVRVDVTDRGGEVVCRATITMWVSPRKIA